MLLFLIHALNFGFSFFDLLNHNLCTCWPDLFPTCLNNYLSRDCFWIVFVCVFCSLLLFSRVWLFVTPWTVAAGPFCAWASPREYWSTLPVFSSGDLANPGVESTSPTCVSCIAGGFLTLRHRGSPLFFTTEIFCQDPIILINRVLWYNCLLTALSRYPSFFFVSKTVLDFIILSKIWDQCFDFHKNLCWNFDWNYTN